MYQNKLVLALKVAGKILREQNGAVQIPFGSEYTVFVKNLNARRAKVKLSIDGTDATSDTWLVVGPNATLELERFIVNGNFNEGRRFKFIERTADIEEHRGIKSDDGLVRCEFQVERAVVDVPVYREYDVPVPRPYYQPQPWDRRWPYPPTPWRKMTASASSGQRSSVQRNRRIVQENFVGAAGAADVSDYGITVQGSVSHQQFHSVQDFPTGESDVMVLHLRGIVAGKAVDVPVTVNAKRQCASCGKTSGSDSEFCPRCGTALVA